MDQLLHLVREVAVVGAELQVEVDHGKLGARLHPAGDECNKQRSERMEQKRLSLHSQQSMSHSNLSINILFSAQIT